MKSAKFFDIGEFAVCDVEPAEPFFLTAIRPNGSVFLPDTRRSFRFVPIGDRNFEFVFQRRRQRRINVFQHTPNLSQTISQRNDRGGRNVVTSQPMRYFLVILLAGMCVSVAAGQECLKRTAEVKPELSAETKKAYELKLADAFTAYTREKESADSTIWLGRRLAYMGNYKDAIRLYGKPLHDYPSCAWL